VSRILDDLDSRPGSTTSLLRTLIGLYLRRLGGWISIADLVHLMQLLDVPASATRTAVARLKTKQLLVSETVNRAIGYRLNPEAVAMLSRGDRRIFAARTMQVDDSWCLISFSLPEELRPLRHQLRRRLSWIGCGMVAPALWICPDFLSEEIEQILEDLDVRDHATLFRTERPRASGDLASAISGWWDLAQLDALHRGVIGQLRGLLAGGRVAPAEAFARYIRGVDAWRVIPYVDPGLPIELLPRNWPGAESTRLFEELSSRHRDEAWSYVARLVNPLTRQGLYPATVR
jgi:phenylacetic acid degradation operon negative regulatory protein